MKSSPRLIFIGACIAAAVLLLGFPASVQAAGGAAVTLTWTPPDDVSNVDYYQYRVSADGGTMWNPDWTIVPGSNAYTNRYVVTGLTFGVEYTFELRSANEFNFSNAISVTARALWPAPPNLAATPGDSQVALQWDRNPEINHYAVRIQGGATPVTQFVQSGSGSKTTATITERPFRKGLSGRCRCGFRKVVETDLEPPCGRRPPESSIAARRCVIRLI